MTRALQFLLPAAALLVGVCSFFYFWGQQSSTPVPLTDATVLTPALHPATAPASAPIALPSNPAPPSVHDAVGIIRSATVTHLGKRPQVANRGAPPSDNAFTSRQSAARSEIGTRIDQSNRATESAPAAQAIALSAIDRAGTVGQTTAASSPSPTVRAPTYPAVFAHNAATANASNKGTQNAQASGAAQAASANPPVTQAEQLMLDKINSDFVTAVGGAGQDPNDPAYQLRWDAAQAASDAQYKKFFGGRAYVRRQIEAAQQAAIEQKAAAKP